jgi:dihydrolipoamide dehydrogenase
MVVGEFAEKRDLMIIGGGPGGYNAAIRAAQLGLSVTLIEKKQLGGVCLNEGCIPSKVFAHAAKEYANVPHLSSLGISTSEINFDYWRLLKYKDKTVNQLRKGVETLCAANKIEIIHGEANFTAENRIGVESGHQFDTYEFKHAIIAAGSSPVKTDFLTDNSGRILSSAEIYNLKEMPKELLVYGSDYIALEIAFSYRSLGSDVSLILDGKEDFSFDHSINRELNRMLKKQKINVYRGFHMDTITTEKNEAKVHLFKDRDEKTVTGSHVYVATQQYADAASLGIDRFGIAMTESEFIETNRQMRTSLNNVFAVGDITAGDSTAVKAIKQGKVAAEAIAGWNSESDLTFLPTIVHTNPPIAAVGLTEQDAIDAGYNVKASSFTHTGNSYAMITNEKSGLTKIIKEEETDMLLGFHTIGAGAIELISTAITSLEMVGRGEDLNFPLYPHPSFNETILEAVEGLTEQAIHMAPVGGKKVRVK